ncbi:LamG domain-containing protein [Vibrio splendidus]|uniref:LamG domain-containing protein n=1 Tax=Vibrio splendidus TaxID=29497 RepID=UPI000E096DC0|nr:LamG domain-containing protein [Vibrio splendidus]
MLLKLRLSSRLLLIVFLFTSFNVDAKKYDLNDLNDFSKLCSGSVSYSSSFYPMIYYCNGVFSSKNDDVNANSGSTILAYGGYNLDGTNIGSNGSNITLKSSTWNSNSNIEKSIIHGNLNLHTALTLSDTYVDGYVKNNVYMSIFISDDSHIAGYVESWFNITVEGSDIKGDVRNNSNSSIYIHEGSSVNGKVNAGTSVTILDSIIKGDVKNRSNNNIYIGDNSEVRGSIDAGSSITVDGSIIKGDVKNRSNNNIYISDDSEIRGSIDAGSSITVNDSLVTGNISNRSDNHVYIESSSKVEGNIIGRGELFLRDSEVLGDIQSLLQDINLDNATVHGNATAANNNWATVYFQDNSEVYGQCLYRTDPIDACQQRGLSPLAQYHFDKNSWGGGNVFDVTDSAGGFNGKAVNQPNLNHNPFEPALINDFKNFGTCGYAQFSNSDNSYVEVQHSSELSFEEELSVSVWIKLGDRYPQGSSLYTIVAKDTNYEFHINSQGKIYWYWLQKNNQTRTLTSNIVIKKNEWYHIVIDYKANRKNSQAKLYINGALDNIVGDNGNKKLKKNNEPLRIGNDANFSTRSFNGYIDEINVFNRSLSPDEVKELYSERHLCDPIDDNLVLVVEPKVEYVLTCEVAAVEFKVVDENGSVISTVQDSFTASHTPSSTGKWCEDESGSNCSTSSGDYQSHFVNGQKTLYLSSSKLDSYDVSGTWNGDLETATSKISFVPYKFDVDEQFVVAGEEYEVTAKVSSCNTQDSSLSQDYVGTPTVSLNIVQPVSGDDAISLLDYTPDFEVSDKGETTDAFSIQEAGQFKITLTDDSFDCSEISGCPESGIDKLSGSFLVNSRPWQFAICTDNNSDGNSSSGAAFVAAGEEFDVLAKPIRFTNDSSQLCNNNLVTQNYLLSSGAIGANHTLDTPSNGDAVLGSLEPSSQLIQSSSDIVSSDNGYKFKSLKYSEVGSINFEVTENSNSFYGKILGGFSGSKSIGRFYPKYFTTIGTPIWDYPGSGVSEQSFAYMNQPFDGVEFEVEALNALGNAITNYASFDTTLTAGFSLFEPNFGDRFSIPVPNKVWTVADNRSIGTFTLSQSSPSTDCDSELCLEKLPTADNYEDGPYNGATGTVTDISITHTGSEDDDPVTYLNEEGSRDPQRLTEQPDIRFGRVELDDVGGNSGSTITIPLRSEYWNGSRFVLNEDDNATNVEASTSASDVIWSEDGSVITTVTLANGGLVSDGESRNLTASQGTGVSIREQVQLWQNMDDIPWLRYDWDSDKVSDEENGEQDPSTVVTFGIYRGNDRVIYRGESGLTGQ